MDLAQRVRREAIATRLSLFVSDCLVFKRFRSLLTFDFSATKNRELLLAVFVSLVLGQLVTGLRRRRNRRHYHPVHRRHPRRRHLARLRFGL